MDIGAVPRGAWTERWEEATVAYKLVYRRLNNPLNALLVMRKIGDTND